MRTEEQRKKNREATKRYREANKDLLKKRRKARWQEALKDPAKMAKIQKDKQVYRVRHRERLAEKQRQWANDNPDKVLDITLRTSFGISLQEYQDKLHSQGGVCAICKKPETASGRTRLSVDHNHKTGQIRDLLCSRCNNGIGNFQEDPKLLAGAISYLVKWGIVVIPPEDTGGSS